METNNATQQQIRRLEEEEKIESFCCDDADLETLLLMKPHSIETPYWL